jgi:hypothetical protein
VAVLSIQLRCELVDLLPKPATALTLGVSADDLGKVGGSLLEGGTWSPWWAKAFATVAMSS